MSTVEPPLQRSHSDIQTQDISPTNILTSTLSAMALSAGEAWNNADNFGKNRPMFAHTSHMEDHRGISTSAPLDLDGGAGTIYSDADGMMGGNSGNDGGVKVPSDKFCGLALSRSLPNTAIDEKNKRVGKAQKKLSNLVIESQFQNDNEDPSTAQAFTRELVENILQMDDTAKALELMLESLDLSSYVSLFKEQEVDLNMFLTLGDGDLKELGIKTFGPRKKIMNAIRECNMVRRQEAPLYSTPIAQPSRPPGLLPPKPAPPMILSAVEPRQQAPGGHQFLQPRKGSPGPNSAIGLSHFHFPPSVVAPVTLLPGPESTKGPASATYRDPINFPLTAPNQARARP
ncbi:Ankyrin repeat and SAM domain-containing protein 6 [Dinochytrium kinnereticum]|nr:Ankyrin repeat and SAM domain-containing protein 6 [Dinochytrium kinnereticum]